MSRQGLDEPVKIDIPEDDRYSRLELLGWWDQDKVRSSTVLVVGAGALGNEVIKNLALLGVGRLLIIDSDRVEISNLSRSVLFREHHQGQLKAQVAANAIRTLNPEVAVRWVVGDVTEVLGLGVFRHVDVVIGCLDNREARLFLNRACYLAGQPWLDGGLNEMLGEVRTFWPGRGGCYECTLNSVDYQIMLQRYSCASLARSHVQDNKIGTSPTSASIIGGVLVQEALKLIHGLEVDCGTTWVWSGLGKEAYLIEHPYRKDCPSHQCLGEVIETRECSSALTSLDHLFSLGRQELGQGAELYLNRELLLEFQCCCGHPGTQILKPVSRTSESAALCPQCGSVRWSRRTHRLKGKESFLDKRLGQIGIPPLDVLTFKLGEQVVSFELSKDLETMLSFD